MAANITNISEKKIINSVILDCKNLKKVLQNLGGFMYANLRTKDKI